MKTRTASMRCNDKQHEWLKRTADELGMSVSRLMFEIIFGDFFIKIQSGILESISNIKAQQEIERMMKEAKHDQ